MGITVQIQAGADAAHSRVIASGSVQHVITDAERSLFGLGDQALKAAVAKYFGNVPNDAYVKGPTPWDDLYKTYGWPQVQTVLAVQSAQILDVTSNPTVLKTTTLRNDSKKPANFLAGVTDNVTNTAETSWSATATAELSQSVDYSIEFKGVGSVGGSTTWSFSQSFGRGGSQSESVSVGSDQSVSVDLDPGECVEAQLTVSNGVMRVRVVYTAHLIGVTAVNYDPTYKDHHFWALDIGTVMAAGGIPNTQSFTEDLQLGYYSNAQVQLSDSSKRVLRAVAAAAG